MPIIGQFGAAPFTVSRRQGREFRVVQQLSDGKLSAFQPQPGRKFPVIRKNLNIRYAMFTPAWLVPHQNRSRPSAYPAPEYIPNTALIFVFPPAALSE